ncbi:hypothetical protein [Mesorhizobium amorphae]|uniref:hypothetical protein n=1 Tax=Mesorhizobium amorphae TaxID=71433 RepID=UPI001FEFB1D1|nr:hypothetical protein [Mesorhizobium amorphae]
MAEHHPECRVSAFDFDILRSAFKKSVSEERIPEDRWRGHAMTLVRELTGLDDVDPDVLDLMMRQVNGQCKNGFAIAEPESQNEPYDPALFAEKHGLPLKSAEIIVDANGPSRRACDAAARAFLDAVATRNKHRP